MLDGENTRKRIFAVRLLAGLLLLTGCGNISPTNAVIRTGDSSPTDTANTMGDTTPTDSVIETEDISPSYSTQSEIKTAGEAVTLPTETAVPQDDPFLLEQFRKDSDFVSVRDYIPEIQVELKYASTDNLTGKAIYKFSDAYLRYGTVKKLNEACKVLAKKGLSLKIWDAYCPPFAKFPSDSVHPDSDNASETDGQDPSNRRGNTVDITLVDSQGKEVKMPTGFDEFSDLSDRDYSDCSPEVAGNALLLEKTMKESGFFGHPKEWWSYSDTEEYPQEECFDPSVISTWYAYGNGNIPMRSEANPAAESVLQIEAGEPCTLLGWEGDFAMIEYERQRGYLAEGDIQPVSDPVNPPVAWTNGSEYLNLQSKPEKGTAITTIPAGEEMTLEKWNGKTALVTYKEVQGYLPANYIKPVNEDYLAECLKVVAPTCRYTYENMVGDIARLQALYPDTVSVSTIGKSELGKEIPVLRMGDPTSQYHVLIQGAMHGVEHQAAWLSMAIADYSLSRNYIQTSAVCYHIIPMMNPDGAAISQSGELSEQQMEIYQQDKALGYTKSDSSSYAAVWKANALGTDLNRNFAAGWEKCTQRTNPSAKFYRGTEPFSATETRAIRDYTLLHGFDATISLHSYGSVIYYSYREKPQVTKRSGSLARAMEKITGYPLLEGAGTDGGGFKDWVMEELEAPSITVEIGCTPSPIKEGDLYNVFSRFQNTIPTINRWLLRSQTE